MRFSPVDEMTHLLSYLFIFILRTSNTSSRIPVGTRTPGWIPLVYCVRQCSSWYLKNLWEYVENYLLSFFPPITLYRIIFEVNPLNNLLLFNFWVVQIVPCSVNSNVYETPRLTALVTFTRAQHCTSSTPNTLMFILGKDQPGKRTDTSYLRSADIRLQFRTGYRLSWLTSFVNFLCPSK